MNLCKYCGQEATFPPKTKWGGWCCCETFYKCDGYKSKLKQSSNPWNKGKTGVQKAWNKGLRGTFTGKHHTDETKRLISNAMCGNRNANNRGDRQSLYKGIRMDSKWEVGTAKYFDAQQIDWKYNEKGFKLSDGRYYYPDFFIYDGANFIKLIEVKGYFREENRKKFEMFLLEYPDIVVELWQKNDLVEKGIINKSGYLIE